MGIHHRSHTHPISIPMGIPMGIPIPTAALVFQGKGKGPHTCYIAAYMSRLKTSSALQSLKVAADWHELMIPWRIVRPSIARDSGQLDPRCSTQTYHRPNQSH